MKKSPLYLSFVIGIFVLICVVFFFPSFYGATSTHTIGGDLAVSGSATLATTTISSLTAVSSTLSSPTITGATISGNVPNTSVITMTSGTSTPCAVQNVSGSTRTGVSVGATFTSTASVGSFGLNVGTSTDSGTTSTSPFINSIVLTVNGTDIISTTSSLMTLSAPWRNNEWLVWKTATTTQAGTCRVLYY